MKRIMAVAVLAVGLTACGSSARASDPKPQELTATTVKTTTTLATTTTAPTTTTTAPDRVVLQLSGSSKTNSDDFTVVGKWSISMNSTGTSAGAGVTVFSVGGAMVDSISFEPGQSTSQLRGGGTYYIEVTPFGGAYDVIVTDTAG